jgi:hypothetical protein
MSNPRKNLQALWGAVSQITFPTEEGRNCTATIRGTLPL